MKTLFTVVGYFALLCLNCAALQVAPMDRRSLISGLTIGVATAYSNIHPASAVIGSKSCTSGVGEGCADLSEGNEFIKALQEKSAAKKEQYRKVGRMSILIVYMANMADAALHLYSLSNV
jgi:hypothetical protein